MTEKDLKIEIIKYLLDKIIDMNSISYTEFLLYRYSSYIKKGAYSVEIMKSIIILSLCFGFDLNSKNNEKQTFKLILNNINPSYDVIFENIEKGSIWTP